MLEIGITGGIGSGKSTVARAFEAVGYRVYYADDRAKLLYDTDAELKSAMVALCGPSILDGEGRFLRKVLADMIFADPGLRTGVNALVHPAVARDYEQWLQSCPADYAKKTVLKEAAILFEARTNTHLDGVIMVYAPKQLRLQRVCTRDGSAPAQVLARMHAQWPDSRKLQLADFVIYNDGQHPLLAQVQQAMQWVEAR